MSFHELQGNVINEGNGRNCRELPGAARRLQRLGVRGEDAEI